MMPVPPRAKASAPRPCKNQLMSDALKPHRGVLILVFGILGLLLCFIFGILAWVMGNQDLAQMNQGLMDSEGRQLTQAGRICGMISVILNVAAVGLMVLFLVVWMFFGMRAY